MKMILIITVSLCLNAFGDDFYDDEDWSQVTPDSYYQPYYDIDHQPYYSFPDSDYDQNNYDEDDTSYARNDDEGY